MGVEIVNAAHDELGHYTGGAAGDQTGQEVVRRPWYNRPWDLIARPKHKHVADAIAAVAAALADNPNVGYDQGNRISLYKECERIGWKTERMREILPCECDCSSLIPVVLRFCGIEIPETTWTGNLFYYLETTGCFDFINDPALLTQSTGLMAGDILINSRYHAAIVISSGSDAPTPAWYTAVVTASDYLQVRTAPAVTAGEYKNSNQSMRLPHNMWVVICEETTGWARLYNINGWVSKRYLRRGN